MSILLIGRSNISYKNKEIMLITSEKEARNYYGEESDLYKAYKELDSIGQKEIYVLSFFSDNDFIDILYKDPPKFFNYIIPINIKLTDFIIFENNKKISLSALLIKYFYEYCDLVIFSSEHAMYFENIEDYIASINYNLYTFQNNKFLTDEISKSASFVTNNLENFKYGNAILASILDNNDLSSYPQKNLGNVIFDLQHDDFSLTNNVIFYSYNDISKTMIENLVNFNLVSESEKYIIPYLIKKNINKQIDINQFKGKLYTSSIKIQILNHVEKVLQRNMGKKIIYYKITDFVVEKNADNTVIVEINIDIFPYGSIEKISTTIRS